MSLISYSNLCINKMVGKWAFKFSFEKVCIILPTITEVILKKGQPLFLQSKWSKQIFADEEYF